MSVLQGKNILVVEDELIVAMMIEQMIEDVGATAIGPATSLEQALDLATNAELDVAILDLNLNGKRTGGVATLLRDRGVPFVFATGYGSSGREDFGQKGVLQKPFQMAQFVSALTSAIDADGDTKRVKP
jgi:CheY-like chemotaxis protein